MKKKPGVNLSVSNEIYFAMGVFHALRMQFFNKPLIVTSANDGQHMAGSKHAVGQAFDSRSGDMGLDERDRLIKEARRILDPLGFDVVSRENPSHQDHDHCEYDPKAGEVFCAQI